MLLIYVSLSVYATQKSWRLLPLLIKENYADSKPEEFFKVIVAIINDGSEYLSKYITIRPITAWIQGR